MKIQKCRKNHIIFWRCDLDLWPTTLKSSSGQDTITINVYTKFENNPSRGFWVIALTPLLAAGGGRLRRKTITSPDPSDTGDIKIANNNKTWRVPRWNYSPSSSPSKSFSITKLPNVNLALWHLTSVKNVGHVPDVWCSVPKQACVNWGPTAFSIQYIQILKTKHCPFDNFDITSGTDHKLS